MLNAAYRMGMLRAAEIVKEMDEGMHVNAAYDLEDAIRAEAGEPQAKPKKCDCWGFGHNPGCPVSLGALMESIAIRAEADTTSAKPARS